ncbi:MAG: lysophospholipid acyltransferase family protein [Spirochaetota bacterium]
MLPAKLLSLIFSVIPDSLVMYAAVVLSPIFYNIIVRKNRLGLRVAKIIPKVFKKREVSWQQHIIRQNSVHLMKLAGEILKAHYKKDWWLNKKCYIAEGRHYLDELFHSGQGFVIMTCHLGNWEYAAAYLAMKYQRLHAPVFVEDSPGNRALNWIRLGHRVELMEASTEPRVSAGTLRKILELLQKGEIVYLVADQEALGGSYQGVFFGKELVLFGGPFIIGRKTGRPLLPMYSLRDEKNRIALHFEEPMYLPGEDLQRDIRKVVDFFERNISRHPDQYIWSQERW